MVRSTFSNWRFVAILSPMLIMADLAIAAPGNDDFAAAYPILQTQRFYTADNTTATLESGEPIFFPTHSKTVWWKYVAPANGNVTIDSAGSYRANGVRVDTGVVIWAGAAKNALLKVDATATKGGVWGGWTWSNFNVTAGQTYMIQVGSMGTDPGGRLRLNVAFHPIGGGVSLSAEDAAAQLLVEGNVGGSYSQNLIRFLQVNSTSATFSECPNNQPVGFTVADCAFPPAHDSAELTLQRSGTAVPASAQTITFFQNYKVSSVTVASPTVPLIILTNTPTPQTTVVSATLPSGRAGQLGVPLTIFASMINAGSTTALNCFPRIDSRFFPVITSYQQTDPQTNQAVGSPNTPVDIPGGKTQSFVLSVNSTEPISGDLPVVADCINTDPAPSLPGVNTMLLTTSGTQPADMVSIGVTPSHDGIMRVPTGGAQVFAVASINIGSNATVTAFPTVTPAGQAQRSLPIGLTICQTNPSTGACLATPSSSVNVTATPNQTLTFSAFAQSNGTPISFNPGQARVFVYFQQGSSIVGGTSTAVQVP